MGQQALDPQDFLEHLKADNQVLHWEPLPPLDRNQLRPRPQTRAKDHLEYLHQHWSLPSSFEPAAPDRGLRGRLTTLLGKLVFRVLGSYLDQERELLAHMVRASQALEQRCDELTLRCHELGEQMVDRQVAEAANQARLAAWLHAEPLAGRTAPAPAAPPSPGAQGRVPPRPDGDVAPGR